MQCLIRGYLTCKAWIWHLLSFSAASHSSIEAVSNDSNKENFFQLIKQNCASKLTSGTKNCEENSNVPSSHLYCPFRLTKPAVKAIARGEWSTHDKCMDGRHLYFSRTLLFEVGPLHRESQHIKKLTEGRLRGTPRPRVKWRCWGKWLIVL